MLLRVGDTEVLVASLQDIIRSKEIADRPPDREALPELRALDDAERSHTVESPALSYDEDPYEIDR